MAAGIAGLTRGIARGGGVLEAWVLPVVVLGVLRADIGGLLREGDLIKSF